MCFSMMTRVAMLNTVSVILRVPGLFLVEAWYRSNPDTIQRQYYTLDFHGKVERPHELVFYLFYYAALLFSLTLIVLPLKKLVHLYMYIVSGLLMLAAHYLSSQYVEWEQFNTERMSPSVFDDGERTKMLGLYIVTQGVICSTIAYLINLGTISRLLMLTMYAAPMMARICNVSALELHQIHNGSTLVAVLIIVCFTFNNIPVMLDLVKEMIRQLLVTVNLYGWIPFLVTMCFKILLPIQFLIFWCILFIMQLYRYVIMASHTLLADGWIMLLLASIGECCVTPVSLMGLCLTVSYVSYTTLTLTKLFLQGREAFAQDNVMHKGWTEGFTMFLLALQTGITELKTAQRTFLMSIVLFIVISSMLQSMFEIVDPLLLALGASQNKNILKHTRALAICSFLWMMPLYMTFIICQFFDMDFWLLVVVSSCVLTSVQVLGSLVVYFLFIYDAIRETPWQNLDDVIYYTKTSTRVLEFIVALFVVGYGVNESIFGEWSFVNVSILIVHFYFNVWQRLQVGWKTYLLRREAANKIKSLPIASEAQLSQHNDVCPICFQQMTSALITPCNHFFHSTCLRKWLYVQDYCPLCHQNLTQQRDSQQPEHAEGDAHVGDQMGNLSGAAPEVPQTGDTIPNDINDSHHGHGEASSSPSDVVGSHSVTDDVTMDGNNSLHDDYSCEDADRRPLLQHDHSGAATACKTT